MKLAPLLAILVFLSAIFFGYNTRANTQEDMEVHLRAQYVSVNAQYFGDRLPEPTIHYSNLPDGRDVIGFSTDLTTNPIIYVVPKYNLKNEQADETLRHEMCHVATSYEDFDHGPAWQNCMKSLADRGAFEGIW